MRCKNCGSTIKQGAAFCAKCGSPVKKSTITDIRRRIRKGIPVLLGAAAIVLLSMISYRVYRVLRTGEEEKTVETLAQDKNELTEESAGGEKETEQTANEAAAIPEVSEEDYEQRIRACYVAREEAQSVAEDFVLAKLSDASYITLDYKAENVGEMITDKVIDELTGNAIVSAGVKAGIEAAVQDMSLESIISNAVEGMTAEVPDYISGEITGAVTDSLGVDLFGTADWISRFMNADDTPVTLANSMLTEQRRDVACVLTFLEQEELTGADMQYMAGIMERIYVRGQELEAAGSSAGGDFSGAEQLEELARVWEKNNYAILYYGQQRDALILKKETGGQDMLSEEQLSFLSEEQIKVREAVDRLSDLYGVSLGGMPINYDVENFREAEKVDAQANQLVGVFFGDIVESILSNKEENNVASAERLRLSLYEFFSDFLEESFREVSAAKATFDGRYSFYEELAQISGEESPAAYGTLRTDMQTEEICAEEKEALLQGLAKYVFDLSCVYEMYETTLTEHETSFLQNVKSQLDSLGQIVEAYDPDGSLYGYTEEEQLERYKEILYQYIGAVEELGIRNADNGIKNGGKYVDYGYGTNQGFLNKGRVILMYGNVSDTGLWEPKKFFYDSVGNPIYIKIGIAEVFLKDGRVLEALPADVENYQTEEWQQQQLKEALKMKEQFETNRFP